MQYEIQLTPPYQYNSFLHRLTHASNRVLFHVKDQSISRLHKIAPGHPPVLASVTPGKTNHTLLLTIQTDEASQANIIYKMWNTMLGIDCPLQPFYDFAAQADPRLARIVSKLAGYQILKDASPFESLINSIIGQQVNLRFAANLKASLLSLVGHQIEIDGETLFAYPLPAEIAALDISLLRERKFSQRKAEYLIGAAQAIESGELNFQELQQESNDAFITKLTSLRGVGRWTAECVLMFGMGRQNLLPAADIGLRNAIQIFYELDHQPKEEEVREIGSKWEPWQSYATYYLWAALDHYRNGAF